MNFVGIFMDVKKKADSREYDGLDLTYINKLFELNHRMVQYLYTATVREMEVWEETPRIELNHSTSAQPTVF